MFVEISEKWSYLGIEIRSGEPKSEEGPAHRLQGIRLDNRPLFNRFRLLLSLQEEADFSGLRNCLIESSNLDDLKLIATGKLLLSWRKDRAILKRIDQILQLTASLWREEDEGFTWTQQYDEFAELGVQKAIIEDLLP